MQNAANCVNMVSVYTELSDEEVVSLAISGDKAAMEHIMSKYKNLARLKSRTYFLAGADRDDIVQEGMIGLFKAIRDFDNTKLSSFKTFAELCIKRQVITAVKTSQRQKHIPLNSYVSLSKPVFDDESGRTICDMMSEGEQFDPEKIMLSQENFIIVKNKINEVLSDFEMTALQMYIDGKSYQDIAKDLHRTPKSIDNALQRVKRKLDRLRAV